MRMLNAHVALLKAELTVAGKELGIIVGIGVSILTLAILVLILLYVGTFLFLGDWLFGSMGWGIIHGSLLTIALIVGLALNLAGGQLGAYGWGFVWGLLVAVVLAILFGFNVLREGAVIGATNVEEAVPLHPNLLPTVVGLVVGAVVAAAAALLAGWRSGWRYGSPGVAAISALLLGGFVGAILASTIFEAPVGVAIAIMIGLLTWMMVGAWLAARRGFDVEARYANLVPRRSMASFEKTKDFVTEQFERQKGRMMGR